MWGALKNIQEFTASSLDKAGQLLDSIDDHVAEETEKEERHNMRVIEPYIEIENLESSGYNNSISSSYNDNNSSVSLSMQSQPSSSSSNRGNNHDKTADDSWDFDEDDGLNSYHSKDKVFDQKRYNSRIKSTPNTDSKLSNSNKNIHSSSSSGNNKQSALDNYSKDAELVALRNEIAIIKAENKSKASSHITDIETLTREKVQLSYTIIELQANNSKLEKELQSANTSASKGFSDDRAKYDQTIHERSELLQQVQELQLQYNQSRKTIADNNELLNTILHEKDQLKITNQQLQVEVNEAKKALLASISTSTDAHQSSMKSLMDEKQSLEDEHEALSLSMKKLKQEYEASVVSLESRNSSLIDQNESIAKREKALIQQIEVLKEAAAAAATTTAIGTASDAPEATATTDTNGTKIDETSGIKILENRLKEIKSMRDTLKVDVGNTLNTFSSELQATVQAMALSASTTAVATSSEVKRLEQLLQAAHVEIDEYKHKIEELKVSQASAYAVKLEAMQSEASTLKSHIATYQIEIDRRDAQLAGEVAHNNQIVTKLEKSLQAQIQENSSIRIALSELETVKAHSQSIVRGLNADLLAASNAITDKCNQMSAVSEELAAARSELNRCMKESESRSIAHSNAVNQNKRIEALEQQIESLNEAVDAATSRALHAEGENAKFNDKKRRDLDNLKRVSERISIVQSEKSEWEAAANQLKGRLEYAEHQSSVWEAMAHDLKASVKDLQNKIVMLEFNAFSNDIVNTTSTGAAVIDDVAMQDVSPMSSGSSGSSSSSVTGIAVASSLSREEDALQLQLKHAKEEIEKLTSQITALSQEVDLAKKQATIAESAKSAAVDELHFQTMTCRNQVELATKRVDALEEERLRLEEELEIIERAHLTAVGNSHTQHKIDRQLFTDDAADVESGGGYTSSDTPRKQDALVLPYWFIQMRYQVASMFPNSIRHKLPSFSRFMIGYLAFVHLLLLYYSSRECSSNVI